MKNIDLIISVSIIILGVVIKYKKVYNFIVQIYGYKLTKEEKEKTPEKLIRQVRLQRHLLLGLGLPWLSGALVFRYFNIYQYWHHFLLITVVIWTIVFIIVCCKNKDVFIDSFKYYGPRTKREF